MEAITTFSSQRMEHLHYSSILLFGNGRFLIKVLVLSSYLVMVIAHKGRVNITVLLLGNGHFSYTGDIQNASTCITILAPKQAS